MPCLIDQIKENTKRQVTDLKAEVELAQEKIKEETKQMAVELKKGQKNIEEKAAKENADNTVGIFELAGLASDLRDAIFDLARLVSELKEMDGDEEMVKLYLIAIKNGEMTIEDVPLLWRKRVQAEIDKELEEDSEETKEPEEPEETEEPEIPEIPAEPEEKEENTNVWGDIEEKNIESSESFSGFYGNGTSILS